jgi:hypothetical protein
MGAKLGIDYEVDPHTPRPQEFLDDMVTNVLARGGYVEFSVPVSHPEGPVHGRQGDISGNGQARIFLFHSTSRIWLRKVSVAVTVASMVDADIERFHTELHATRHGLRLRMAIHESNIAVYQIERLRLLGGHTQRAIETWRVAYIKSCNSASLAIDALWDEYRWPTDASRDRNFVFHPRGKGDLRPLSRP